MKPEHETRRKIIREWMSLPKDKRQTEEQAKPFAKKAMERIPSSGDPYRKIMRWLLPRIGRPGSIVARGLAFTRADTRAAAITSAAGLGDEPTEDCTLPLEGQSIRAS